MSIKSIKHQPLKLLSIKEMNWQDFKIKSERLFENLELFECYGYQIQSGTKWNSGLEASQIQELERMFGFIFPYEYKNMLLVINSFDRDEISIDPENIEEDDYDRRCYKYPEDFLKVQWLIKEIKENIEYVNEALLIEGFDINDVVGFVPLYLHRALVVFNDKTLTPVISIHQGTDVIVFGSSLMDYWERELGLKSRDSV